MSDIHRPTCPTCSMPLDKCVNCGTDNPLVAKLAAAEARIAELEIGNTRDRKAMFDAIRENCIYAMFSMIDAGFDNTNRSMNVEAFKQRARIVYTGQHPCRNDVACNLFHAKVECLVQAIWEEVFGKKGRK
jgi:hypothetical protein